MLALAAIHKLLPEGALVSWRKTRQVRETARRLDASRWEKTSERTSSGAEVKSSSFCGSKWVSFVRGGEQVSLHSFLALPLPLLFPPPALAAFFSGGAGAAYGGEE